MGRKNDFLLKIDLINKNGNNDNNRLMCMPTI